MKKKVLFIIPSYHFSQEIKDKSIPSTKLRGVVAFPLGPLSIMTYCKDLADFKLIDCNVDENYMESILWEMRKFKPEIVGISLTFDSSYGNIAGLLKVVRDMDPNVVTVIGGVATIPKYRDVLAEQENVDAVCFDAGEVPFRRLLESNFSFNVLHHDPSWITRESLALGIVPVRSPIQNLDDTLEIDYSFVNIADYPMLEDSLFEDMAKGERQFYVETSKGCPWSCLFCYYSRHNNKQMRYASIDKVIGYVRKLKEELGMTVLTISDDQFLVNMKRAKEIFRQLEQFHIRVEILQGASVSFIDEEMVILMKKAGVKRVSLPLESGSKEMLEKMVSKPVDLDQARKVVGWLRKHGLWVQTFFVQGFPGETDEHRAEAVKWIMETGLDWSTFCQAIPIWGTKLYDICVEGGYIRPDMKLGELDFHNYTINVPGYPAEYVTREIYKMNLQCNFLNNYHMSQREYRIAANAFRKVVYMYPNHAFAHWFLAKCLEMMGNNAKEIGEHRDKFKEIVATDKNWAEYAKEFKLEE